MLEVRDVLKTYDGRAVVNRVSFDVRPGEVFALLGPNGAGKTTLIRMITDILRPDAGTVRLEGRAIDASVTIGDIEARALPGIGAGPVHSLNATGPGKYRLHVHLGAGQIRLLTEEL